MGRVIGLMVLAGVLGGCTTVKMVQRDGCWIRQTSRTLGGAKEEIGPCMRPQPQWSEDRLTRLVQECVAQADHRWQVLALDAWNQGRSLPAQQSQEAVIQTCMNEAATGVVTQNESLRQRLADVSGDREALRADAEQTAEHLRTSNAKIAEFLGEAAKQPPPVATASATATSDGTATTDNGFRSETGSSSGALPAVIPLTGPAPAVPITTPPGPRATPDGPPVARAPPADPAAPRAATPSTRASPPPSPTAEVTASPKPHASKPAATTPTKPTASKPTDAPATDESARREPVTSNTKKRAGRSNPLVRASSAPACQVSAPPDCDIAGSTPAESRAAGDPAARDDASGAP